MPSLPRIVSLLPSATEIVCALGAVDQLVGVSHECDFPDEVRGRPVLTGARIDSSASSREIDAAVREVVQNALSVYVVDDRALDALRPDVIVTQDLCEVCAVSLDDVRAAVAKLGDSGNVEIVSLRPTRLNDVFGDMERVAAAIDRVPEGQSLRQSMERRVEAIAVRAAEATVRPRVASLEWVDPLMLGATWMPELIDRAGGLAVGVEAGADAPTIDESALRELEPEVVVVKPCGFDLERAMVERDIVDQTVCAVLPESTRIYVTDGNAFFNRPGPRIVESVEIMAACIHPELFDDFMTKHDSVIRRLR